ncbi:MAG TPA: methylated-DNA--[protein]-cysteine S-methyltransferase [Novimethylophilus sp.]|uniref:methylated-DNA--[protein]-cysteine S-methyltransferase n=1 Tax=Novimethylophilus sp. TaxID=2137426 RepID=UPI002F3EFCE3
MTEIDFLLHSTPPLAPSSGIARAVRRAIEHYLQHPHCDFDLPLAVAGTPFQRRVWDELRRIPAGQAITYAELACRVGSGARAVANACGANPIPVIIPCHRVVAANGLGGFMRGHMDSSLDIKRWLLTHERSAPGAA